MEPVSRFLIIISKLSDEGRPRTLIISKASPFEIVVEASGIEQRVRIFPPLVHICSGRSLAGVEAAIVEGREGEDNRSGTDTGSFLGDEDGLGDLIAGRFKVT